jgi:DNA-binding transcriptional LysR family regulator
MEIMQLEMFVAVVEERSFLRAAERVFRTQPAVSIGLRKLEARIGIPLLDRSHRRSGQLTAAGEILYEYASRILALRDEALSALKEEHCPSAGILHIGVTIGEKFDWIPQLSTSFNNRYPEIRLEIFCDRPLNLFKDLVERRIDIALLSGRPRGDAQSKSLMMTRVRGCRPHHAFWVVRRRLGEPQLACAFEEILMGHFKGSTSAPSAKQIEVRSLSVTKTSATNCHSSAESTSQ